MALQEKDLDLYRDILRNYPTGVTVITAIDDVGEPVGMTANSFTSVSMDPLMVSWCIDKSSRNIETFKNASKFAVNILAGNQEEVGRIFASRKETNRFSKVKWEYSKNNLPIIEGVFSVFECDMADQINAGDHIILLGNVIDLRKNAIEPMLYYQRSMGYVPSYETSK